MVVINIDTSKDSKEEIREIVKMLQAIVGETIQNSETQDNFFGAPIKKQETPTEMFGMFDDNSNNSSSETSNVFNIFDDEKEEITITKEQSANDILKLVSEDEENATIEVADEEEATIEVEDDKDAVIEIVEF